MSSTKDNSILHDQLLKCPICFEIYGNMNKPIIIPCGHTICSICIEKIVKSDSLNDSLNSDSNNSNNLSSDSFLRIQSFEEDLNSNYEGSNDEEEEEDDEDNEEVEEEEEEDEEEFLGLTENSDVMSMQGFSENSNRDNIDMNNNLNNHNSNRGERIKKDEKNKLIKIRCSICRLKSKTQRKNLIINNDILDLIKSLLEGDTITEGKDNIVFCIECKNHFKENIHKHDFPNHESKTFHLEYFVDNIKELNKYEKKINNIYSPLSKKIMSRFIDKIKKINIKIEEFMKEFSPFYNIFYMINYLETKLLKIYSKYQEAFKDNNFEEMEISLCNVESVVTKFFQKIYIPIIIKENFMKSSEVYSDFCDIVKNSLLYKINSINVNSMKTDRKYLIAVGDNKVYIYDARTKYSFEIKYSKIFENFDSKKRKQLKKNYDVEKNFTEYVDISENGRYIMMIGKSEGESKKFRVYDIFENKITKKPNMSIKLSSVDMFYYDKKLFILGGINLEGYVRNCEYYDFVTEKWNPLPSLNLPRELKSILVINDHLLVYFGNNEDSSIDVNTFESINLKELKSENLTWNCFKIKNLNQEFSYNGINSVINENIFFIFGGVTKDYEDQIESGFVIDFNNREIIKEIKLDKKCNYISTNISSTYGNIVCWIDSEEVEEICKFDLTTLNIK